MFMVCSWSRNMVLAYTYSNASVHDRTVASVWELVGTFLWKTVYSKMQFTLHSQLASIQQLDKYSSPWPNKSVNTNNMEDSALLGYGTALQKAFQDQSITENEGTMFPQNTGIWLLTDTTSQTTRAQLSATLLQKPQNSPAIMFMAWYSGFKYSKECFIWLWMHTITHAVGTELVCLALDCSIAVPPQWVRPHWLWEWRIECYKVWYIYMC